MHTMNIRFFLLVLLMLSANGSLHAQQHPSFHKPRQFYITANPEQNIHARPESSGNSGTGGNIDMLYNKIYWRINPDSTVKYIRGYVQMNFKTIQASVSTISFDLNSVLIIDSVRFRNLRLSPASIVRTGNIVAVNLGVTLPNDFIDSFTVYYQGAPPAAVGAAQGYQRATSSTAGSYITTLSESYEDRDWWPCKADMQDKIDSMDITVNVPWGAPTAADTFWVSCNGKLVDSTITGTNRNFVFKSRYPIASYLVFVSVARYSRFYRSVNISGTEVPVQYDLFRGKTTTQYNNILTAMDKINPVVVAFSTKYGDYPFKNEKHGFYDGLLGAGGMEHQTMSGIATGALADLSTLAHELGHQWFGDNVTFGTWNDLWLAEGFATYSEALAGELVPSLGINPFSVRSGFKSSALSNTVSAWIPNSNTGNSGVIWNSSYGSAVYVRGAMIVSMLRAISGDQKFFQALTNYQDALKGKSATTDMLKAHFNAVLGTDITPFFNDYVGGSGVAATAVGGRGFPTNTVNWNTPVPNKLVIQAASQTQSAVSNVSYFRGPVVLHVKGATAAQDTTITYFDWGGGNLSFAGNGIAPPVSGGKLSIILSFTPTTVAYDDSARTLSNGTMVFVPGLNDNGFSFNSAVAATATCPAPITMSTSLATNASGGFSNPITLSAIAGVPAGTTVTFGTNPVAPGSSSNIVLNNTNTLAAGTYNITIQGAATGATAQTTVVSYTINPGSGPAITTQPASRTVCAGSDASFGVVATAATSYQWQVSTDGGASWTNITGATNNTVTITGITAGMNNNQYRCIASTICGSTTSGAATLNVNTAATIALQPAGVTVCAGGTTTLCVNATGTNLVYQWQVAINCTTSPWVNIANALPYSGNTTSCLTISNVPASFNGFAYRCVVSSAACTGAVTTNCAGLTVNTPATINITTQPADVSICAGGNATFNTAATSTLPITYQWEQSTDGGANWNAIAGATTASYTVSNANTTLNNTRYRCRMVNNAPCGGQAVSSAAILTVRALPTVGLTASPLTSLTPGTTTTLTATPSASAGGTISTAWLYNGNPITVTGNSYPVNITQTGSYQVRIQEAWPGGPTCTNQSPVVVIDAKESGRLFIYPNPNNGFYAVSYFNSGGAATTQQVMVYDAKGSAVYSKKYSIAGPYTFMQVDMQRANAGIYTVVVYDAQGKKLAEGKVMIR